MSRVLEIEPSELQSAAFTLWKDYLVRLNPRLLMAIGALIHTEGIYLEELPAGVAFHLRCPNKKMVKELKRMELDLFRSLNKFFNLNRILISTQDDPFSTVPADYWQSEGIYPLPDGTFIGSGSVDGKPHWHCIVSLDEDGYIKR